MSYQDQSQQQYSTPQLPSYEQFLSQNQQESRYVPIVSEQQFQNQLQQQQIENQSQPQLQDDQSAQNKINTKLNLINIQENYQYQQQQPNNQQGFNNNIGRNTILSPKSNSLLDKTKQMAHSLTQRLSTNSTLIHPQLQGGIVIHSLQARVEKDVQIFGEMSCYCKIQLDNQIQQTSTLINQGRKPEWHDKFSFRTQNSAEIIFKIYNKNNIMKDDFLGYAILNINNVFGFGGFKKDNYKIDLITNKRKSGDMQISLELLTTNDIYDSEKLGFNYEERNGMVIVSDIQGKLFPDQTDYIHSLDSFIEIYMFRGYQEGVKNHIVRSKVCKMGNLYPNWKDELHVRRIDDYIMHIKLWKQSITGVKKIGSVQMYLKELYDQGEILKKKVHLYDQGHIIGDIQMKLQWLPDTEQREGTIIVRPVKAELKRDTELIGQMDPFVKITIGSTVQSSLVIDEAGKHPQWDSRDELIFYRTNEFDAKIQVFDQDVTVDDLVGESEVSLLEVLQHNYVENEIQIYYKNMEAGSIVLQWLWIPDFENRPGYIQIQAKNDDQRIVVKGNKKNAKAQQRVIYRRLDEIKSDIIIYNKKGKKIGSTLLPLCRIFQKSDIIQQMELNLKNNGKYIDQKANVEISWHPDVEQTTGYITLRPIQAELTKDTELFGQMDPYILVQVGQSQSKSSVHQNGGKTPKWKDVFKFHRLNEYVLHLKVMDKDLTYDDFVGEAKFNLSDLFHAKDRVYDGWLDLINNEKIVGQIYIILEWEPDTTSPYDLNEDIDNVGKVIRECKESVETDQNNQQFLIDQQQLNMIQQQSTSRFQYEQQVLSQSNGQPQPLYASPSRRKNQAHIFTDDKQSQQTPGKIDDLMKSAKRDICFSQPRDWRNKENQEQNNESQQQITQNNNNQTIRTGDQLGSYQTQLESTSNLQDHSTQDFKKTLKKKQMEKKDLRDKKKSQQNLEDLQEERNLKKFLKQSNKKLENIFLGKGAVLGKDGQEQEKSKEKEDLQLEIQKQEQKVQDLKELKKLNIYGDGYNHQGLVLQKDPRLGFIADNYLKQGKFGWEGDDIQYQDENTIQGSEEIRQIKIEQQYDNNRCKGNQTYNFNKFFDD